METYIDLGNCRVSNLGNVKVTRVLKKQINRNGYETVRLNEGEGKFKWHTVHRLVARAFIPNPHNLPCVNHIDGNKANNDVNNLEWCTRSQNSQHAYDKGLQSNASQYKAIQQIDPQTGEVLNTFDSISKACKELGAVVWDEVRIKTGNISACAKGKKKTAYNYIWRYAR